MARVLDRNQTQMNVRIDEKLKRDGDAVLAAAGFTPSQGVRALYRYALAHAHDPETVARLLACESEDDRAQRRERRLEALRAACRLVEDECARLGISLDDAFIDRPYRELRNDLYAEKIGEVLA